MNKKNILFTLLITLFLFVPLNIKASFAAEIKGTSVRIRKEHNANSDNSIIATVNAGTSITVVDKTLYVGSGCSNKWYKIIYKEQEAYVCSKYVNFIDNTFTGINVIDWTARVNANNVAVRNKAATNGSLLDTLTLGANVTILKTVSGSTSGCSGGKWHQITYYGNKTGYICKNYVTEKKDTILEDAEYAKTLKSAGFPDSYIPYLTYLHNKYPNWQFKPGITKKRFASSVSGEEGKNYMQTKNDNYRTSSKPAEGSSWFKVNSGVIAFYLDPRNWLTEERIFMFEDLNYDQTLEKEYPALIKSVFSGGKLADDKYTVPMFNAAKSHKISPLHIATRIRLEVGPNGSDSTNGTKFTWKGNTYSGYYNFFNIGAYETTIDGVKYSAITRGLAYAAKLINRDGNKWDNIETSILEGSSLLAKGYVNAGQGTLYYQKFNVGPNAYYDKYTHQYQTNIQAPATEGNKTYDALKKANQLNQKFTFEIPVYLDMPEYTSLPKSGDMNNNLKTLEVEGYHITPTFDEDVLTYETYIPNTVNEVNIKATTQSSKASISGTGKYELKDKETDITITVLSETQEEKKYVVTIIRVEDNTTVNDALQNSGLTSDGNYILKIKNKTNVSLIKEKLLSAKALSISITDSNNKELTDKSYITTGTKIKIITAMETKSFTMIVNGDLSGDGAITILDLLQIQKYLLGDKKLTKEATLAADTSGDGKVTILDLLQVQKYLLGDKEL